MADYIYKHSGVRLECRPISDLKPLLETVDQAKAMEEMQRFKKGSMEIVEPTDDSLLKSSRMYVLLRSIMEKDGLSGISIDCLSFFFEPNPMLPLPCLAYTRLRDEGITAACEADVCMLLSSIFLFVRKRSRRCSGQDEKNAEILLEHGGSENKLCRPLYSKHCRYPPGFCPGKLHERDLRSCG